MGMRWIGVLMLVLGACESDRDTGATPDAPLADAATEPMDAPYVCLPVSQGPPPACLALGPADLQGSTPFGTLDVGLQAFGAGDCVTISSATISWRGACGEELTAQFPYPVTNSTSGRAVTTSFDTEARFTFEAPDAEPRVHVTTIHVDVALWQEHESTGTHDLDITMTVSDPAYAIGSIHVQGTFCDWPYYLC